MKSESDVAGASKGVLGVLGGMGPAATADFYTKLVKATPAIRDQEHIPVVVVGDPRIADRSVAIETGTQADVLAGLLRGLRGLEAIGVDAIAMPCNTAHWWLARLRAQTSIPFISLIEASALEARSVSPRASTALVLGTRSTVTTRLYDAELEKVGFSVVTPTERQLEQAGAIITSVKAGNVAFAEAAFRRAAKSWRDEADVVLLACTELPLAASSSLGERSVFIDTTAALVSACVAWAKAFRGTSGAGPEGSDFLCE